MARLEFCDSAADLSRASCNLLMCVVLILMCACVQVPRARGAVRAGERARPGAGEQGVRLPQGPPRRAPLLAPGREQGHGPRPRRALGAARPPRMAPGRPRPRRPEPPPPPPLARRRRPPPPSQPSKRRPRWCHGRRPVGTKMMNDMAATCARSHRPSKRGV
jgi:hypothetical protein